MNEVNWDMNNVRTCAKCGGLMGTNVAGDVLCHCGSTAAKPSVVNKDEAERNENTVPLQR